MVSFEYMHIYRRMHDFVQEATGTVYRSAQNFLHLKKKVRNHGITP